MPGDKEESSEESVSDLSCAEDEASILDDIDPDELFSDEESNKKVRATLRECTCTVLRNLEMVLPSSTYFAF